MIPADLSLMKLLAAAEEEPPDGPDDSQQQDEEGERLQQKLRRFPHQIQNEQAACHDRRDHDGIMRRHACRQPQAVALTATGARAACRKRSAP